MHPTSLHMEDFLLGEEHMMTAPEPRQQRQQPRKDRNYPVKPRRLDQASREDGAVLTVRQSLHPDRQDDVDATGATSPSRRRCRRRSQWPAPASTTTVAATWPTPCRGPSGHPRRGRRIRQRVRSCCKATPPPPPWHRRWDQHWPHRPSALRRRKRSGSSTSAMRRSGRA